MALTAQLLLKSALAIVGQSGAGKTTMMKLLVGLYRPESGAIYIDSVDTSLLKLDYLRNNVNYINQRTTLFNETVMYNMLYGNSGVSEKTVIAKLKKYGAGSKNIEETLDHILTRKK